jgi:hypothetical protein
MWYFPRQRSSSSVPIPSFFTLQLPVCSRVPLAACLHEIAISPIFKRLLPLLRPRKSHLPSFQWFAASFGKTGGLFSSAWAEISAQSGGFPTKSLIICIYTSRGRNPFIICIYKNTGGIPLARSWSTFKRPVREASLFAFLPKEHVTPSRFLSTKLSVFARKHESGVPKRFVRCFQRCAVRTSVNLRLPAALRKVGMGLVTQMEIQQMPVPDKPEKAEAARRQHRVPDLVPAPLLRIAPQLHAVVHRDHRADAGQQSEHL